MNNLINTCGLGFPGFPIFPPNVPAGTSPCTRYISIYADTIASNAPLPIANSATLFQGLFNPAGNPSGTNLIACKTPAPGQNACITPADVEAFGIIPSNSGQLAPLQAVFSNPPNYKPPYSQQASLGIERQITPGFTVGASGIYSHTLRLPVAIDTNLTPAPESTIALANGQVVSNPKTGTPVRSRTRLPVCRFPDLARAASIPARSFQTCSASRFRLAS